MAGTARTSPRLPRPDRAESLPSFFASKRHSKSAEAKALKRRRIEMDGSNDIIEFVDRKPDAKPKPHSTHKRKPNRPPKRCCASLPFAVRA